MLVYAIYPVGGTSIRGQHIPGYLESCSPTDISYSEWRKNKKFLREATYTEVDLKKMFNIEVSPIRFTLHTIKLLSFTRLVELQQKINFPLQEGRSVEVYRKSFFNFMRLQNP